MWGLSVWWVWFSGARVTWGQLCVLTHFSPNHLNRCVSLASVHSGYDPAWDPLWSAGRACWDTCWCPVLWLGRGTDLMFSDWISVDIPSLLNTSPFKPSPRVKLLSVIADFFFFLPPLPVAWWQWVALHNGYQQCTSKADSKWLFQHKFTFLWRFSIIQVVGYSKKAETRGPGLVEFTFFLIFSTSVIQLHTNILAVTENQQEERENQSTGGGKWQEMTVTVCRNAPKARTVAPTLERAGLQMWFPGDLRLIVALKCHIYLHAFSFFFSFF